MGASITEAWAYRLTYWPAFNETSTDEENGVKWALTVGLEIEFPVQTRLAREPFFLRPMNDAAAKVRNQTGPPDTPRWRSQSASHWCCGYISTNRRSIWIERPRCDL